MHPMTSMALLYTSVGLLAIRWRLRTLAVGHFLIAVLFGIARLVL